MMMCPECRVENYKAGSSAFSLVFTEKGERIQVTSTLCENCVQGNFDATSGWLNIRKKKE